MLRATQKDSAFLQVAGTIGTLSTCDRGSVGCVIVRDGRCVTWGFNGAPPGLPHCSENYHGWQEHDWPVEGGESPEPWMSRKLAEVGCRNATHAEANALAFAARQGISTEGATAYLTVSPCDACSRLLIAAGIVRVVWETEYRDPAGSRLLAEAGVELQ